MRDRTPHWVEGDALAVCDSCKFTVYHSTLRRRWDGPLVCERCWEPRPDQERPKTPREDGQTVRNARPDPWAGQYFTDGLTEDFDEEVITEDTPDGVDGEIMLEDG